MKAQEVMRTLNISRATLSRYVKDAHIQAVKQENGQYDYDAESVFAFLTKQTARDIIAYVATADDSTIQIETAKQQIEQYTKSHHLDNAQIYHDKNCLDTRDGFYQFVEHILTKKAKCALIHNTAVTTETHQLLTYIAQSVHCKYIIIS